VFQNPHLLEQRRRSSSTAYFQQIAGPPAVGPFGTILRGLWKSTRSQSVNWEGEVPEICMVRRLTAREKRRVDRQICANVFGLCVESGDSWPWWVALRALPDKRDGHGRPF